MKIRGTLTERLFTQAELREVGQRARLKEDLGTCECADPGCPVHTFSSKCTAPAVDTIYRMDMGDDETGTRMCSPCIGDALESGIFTTKDNDDLLARRNSR